MGGLPEQQGCRVCGAKLNRHQRIDGLCGAAECRRQNVRCQLQLRNASIEAQLESVVPAEWPPGRDKVILPHFTAEITSSCPRRQAQFREHLEKTLAAVAEEIGSTGEPVSTDPQSGGHTPTPLPVLSDACRLCRGYCCRLGGTTAFLEPATIRRVAIAGKHGGERIAEIKSLYLNHLPEHTYAGSCVFHTTGGCALPRNMRADRCNEYFCEALSDVRGKVQQSHEPTLLAAVSGSVVHRVAVTDASGVLVERSLS